jgi:hypothetical protein
MKTNDDLIAALWASISKEESQEAWARKHGVDKSLLCGVLQGRREITPQIASVLGYVPQRMWKRSKKN